MPGSPILYYGDEIGMGDDITQADRNGVRTPMQWDTTENAGFSRAPREQLYMPLISDPVFGYTSVNVEAQREDRSSLLHTIREMIYTRKRLPVLGVGRLEWWHHLPNELLCFKRVSEYDAFLALHNLSDQDRVVDLDGTYKDALANTDEIIEGQIQLLPYGYRWLEQL